MTTTPVPPVDIDLLREEIRKTYAAVSTQPDVELIFPTGRKWAEDLGYPELLANVPESATESFAGVANPFSLGPIERGAAVLDIGSGAGTDSLVAAQMVGVEGTVTGIDMTPKMLEKALSAAAEMALRSPSAVTSASARDRPRRGSPACRSGRGTLHFVDARRRECCTHVRKGSAEQRSARVSRSGSPAGVSAGTATRGTGSWTPGSTPSRRAATPG